jgi:hypothetical protein
LITKKCSSLKGQGIGLKGQVLIGLRGRIRGLGDRIWNGLEDLGLVGELRAVASGCCGPAYGISQSSLNPFL